MPGTRERPIAGPRKRLIVACDGTWLDSDNGLMNGMKQPPSNVSRIGWAIKETSRDGIPQVVQYQAGVGSHGGTVSRAVGGATGAGLKENVREAYSYLAINWREGDEIFLLGFSRGAFTARSDAGLIGELGLLTRRGLPYFSEIFEDVEHQHDDRYVSKYPDDPYPGKGRFNREYVHQLSHRGMTRVNVPIRAVGVWDTVGALGVPRIPLLESLGIQSRQMRDYSFYDTRLSPCIENAFQALALDEQRDPIMPTPRQRPHSPQASLVPRCSLQHWWRLRRPGPGQHYTCLDDRQARDLDRLSSRFYHDLLRVESSLLQRDLSTRSLVVVWRDL